MLGGKEEGGRDVRGRPKAGYKLAARGHSAGVGLRVGSSLRAAVASALCR